MYRISFLFLALLLLLLPTTASAQSSIFDDSYITLQMAYKTTLPTTPAPDYFGKAEIEKPFLGLRLDDFCSDYRQPPIFTDYWTNYANRPNDVYITQYEGLQRLIHKHAMRIVKKYYKRQLRELWANSTLHPLDLDRRIRQYYLEAGDCEYRWWERSWMDSFPIEQGGSQVRIHTIGHTHEILNLGPITLNNRGKLRWGRWRISFSHDRDEDEKPKSSDDSTDTSEEALEKENDPDPVVEYNQRDFVVGVRPPKGNLLTLGSWTLSGSVNLNIRIDELEDNGSSIRGGLALIGYTSPSTPVIGIELLGYAKPVRGEYGIELVVTLLQF